MTSQTEVRPQTLAAPIQGQAALLAHAVPWLVGLLFVLLMVPAGYLDGSAPLLLRPINDFLQHQTGILAYLNEPWHWPPFHTTLLAAPDSVSLVFTDSLPLPTFLAKVIQSLTGWQLPVLGWWLVATYLLQPVAMAAVLRALGVERPLPLLAGSVIAVMLPWFLWRFGHTALAGHFLLLFQLALVLGLPRARLPGPRLLAVGALAWFALLVHAYLFLMVAAVGFGGFCDVLRRGQLGWRQSLPGLLLWLAGTAAILWVAGYFVFSGPLWGYGNYSMNLLAPLVPQASGLLPGFADWLLGDASHALLEVPPPLRPHGGFADMLDATGGQYEGYAWLGFGVVGLAVFALLRCRRELGELWRRHRLLVLVALAFTAAAVSNQIWLGHWRVLALPEPPAILGAFRSNGRLVWPLLYLVVAAALAVVASLPRQRLAATLLLAAAALQTADARVLVVRLYENLRAEPAEHFPAELWRPLIAAHERLLVFPRYDCVGGHFEPAKGLAFHAAALGVPVNTAQVSRQQQVDCQGDLASLPWRGAEPGTLLVILDPYAEWIGEWLSPHLKPHCRAFSGPVPGLACTLGWAALGDGAPAANFAEPAR
jgi:hypothetical protein